jgi:hypothetical protein
VDKEKLHNAVGQEWRIAMFACGNNLFQPALRNATFFGDLTVYSSLLRLTPVCVIAAMLSAPLPAHAQFAGAGGVTAPRTLPRPVFGGYPYGGYGMYGGYGWGTQWMQNPYQGYLSGAADVTTANAQYQQTIQQAKLTREEARRSALQTRRATLEERQYELSLQPDPEKIRQEQMMKSLQRSRNNPPLVEIWSATALNDLLRDIQSTQTGSASVREVALPPEVLQHINVTTGTTYGGVGLLRGDGKLTWPFVLQGPYFDAERTRLDQLLPQAVQAARGGQVPYKLVTDIDTAQKELERSLDAHVADLTPSEFTEASRYVRELKDSIRVLRQSDVAKYFRPAWTPKGATVGELVQQMTREGLKFAPAVSGDEPYYTSLHRALVDYDLGVAQLRTVPSPTSR